jgi:hypothetical protein
MGKVDPKKLRCMVLLWVLFFVFFFVLEVDGQLEEMESWLFVISFFNIQQRNGRIVELQKKKKKPKKQKP